MQLVAVGHDTSVRLLSLPGFGLDTIDQRVPFHRSTNVLVLALPLESPTAMQLLGLEHDTLLSVAEPVGGFGLFTTDQRVPFQRSTSVPACPPPTAKQLVALGHATPLNEPSFFALASFHVEPFQCSISASSGEVLNELPTAKQLVDRAHATPKSEPVGGPGGRGLAAIDQVGLAFAGAAPDANPPATRPTQNATRAIVPRTRAPLDAEPWMAYLTRPSA